ncbi:hypothetical protein HDU83_001201 [Entophlyctis luteolus]|nr:hypothetical protein HDU83_001201 [Entophlyctis luteolus]
MLLLEALAIVLVGVAKKGAFPVDLSLELQIRKSSPLIFSLIDSANGLTVAAISSILTTGSFSILQIVGFAVSTFGLLFQHDWTIRMPRVVFGVLSVLFVFTFAFFAINANRLPPDLAPRVFTVDDENPQFQSITNTYISANTRSAMDIVIAYYQEDVENLHQILESLKAIESIQSRNPRVIVYVKGSGVNLTKLQNATNAAEIHVVSNIGREGHTYLRHIVKSYDNDLADYTIFFQGAPDYLVTSRLVSAFHDQVGFINLGDMMKNPWIGPDHEGDEWPWIRTIYGLVNNGSQLVEGEWLTVTFDFSNVHISSINPKHIYLGQFLVSRRRIQQNSKEFYNYLISLLELGISDKIHVEPMFAWFRENYNISTPSNPVFGHVVERSWGVIFHCAHPSIFDDCKQSDDLCRCLDQ